jgi:hypothetical protein
MVVIGHPELARLLVMARDNDCTYLRLTSDNEVVEGLPVFDW